MHDEDQTDRLDELWPAPIDDLDIAARLAADDRQPPSGRPWVTLSMIESLDGEIAIDGLSGGLGGPADQRRFVAARRQMEAIVVGATTARHEDYQPTSVPIAVVTGSLSLDPAARLFGDPSRRPILYTTEDSAERRGDRFAGVAEVVALGESIEPAAILADLDRRAIRTVALEGGPTLNGYFWQADLVDELLLTLSPRVIGGDRSRIALSSESLDRSMRLDRVSRAGDLLFLRYLRAS